MKIVTADEMRRLDRETVETYKIPVLVLMEQAGMGVVREMERRYGELGQRSIVVLAGKGHNGGDGLVAARHLLQRGADVQVFLAFPADAMRGEAKTQAEIFRNIGGRIADPSAFDRGAFRSALAEADVALDALVGTGLSSPLSGFAAELIADLNAARRPVVAIDLPSGISADTGEMLGAAVRADLTVAFALPKRGHFLPPGSEHTGDLQVVDIGIPKRAVEHAALPLSLFTEGEAVARLPRRPREGHKGTFGHVFVVAGSRGRSGAAMLASRAALRAGAGLTTLACPESVLHAGEEKSAEIMTLPLPETAEHTLAARALDLLLSASKNATVVAVGPGLSTHPETQAVVRELIARLTVPMVVDADGLNALADHLEPLRRPHAPMILTPHPGEMGRLTRLGTREVQHRRIELAVEFARAHHVVLVLKGARTVVATPDGRATINPTGNAGMATAGTGDALTGAIAGLLAQGLSVEDAARLGVYLHGLAGDLLAAERGERGMMAGDLVNGIPAALRRLSPMSDGPPHRLFKRTRPDGATRSES
ncbi:MAG: NAD(P)H-hydrate dehydratase [Nitrospirae bacterium]|nr:NAD(P)H-hydrate dehydratase [Nitrospirota bacterium]